MYILSKRSRFLFLTSRPEFRADATRRDARTGRAVARCHGKTKARVYLSSITSSCRSAVVGAAPYRIGGLDLAWFSPEDLTRLR